MNSKRLFIAITTTVLALASQVKAQTFLTNGLVAYYQFNGNATDASGHGNDGTVEGATLTTDRFGLTNKAYAFNGSQSRIRVPETLFYQTNAAVTMSAWVTTDNGPYTSEQFIFEKGPQNGEVAMEILFSQFVFKAKLASSATFYSAQVPVISNAVTHLVGVYERGHAISLYTNGVLAQSVPVPDDDLYVLNFPYYSAIGIYYFSGGPFNAFRGTIDDVRVYTRAFTSNEVQQLFNLETSVKPFGFSLGLRPSLTITGAVGHNYTIQRTVDLVNTNTWTTVTNLTLSQAEQLWVDTSVDASLPANPQRFYRVLPAN